MSRSRPHPNTQSVSPPSLPAPRWADAPAFGRRETLLRTLRRLHALHPASPTIVETGTLRDDRDVARFGDGWSTLAWGWYASQTGGKVTTVDLNPVAIAVCRKRTQPYAASIEYVAADSLVFLQQWQQEQCSPIHLLYLDSLDYTDPERSEQHHLLEAQAALPSLAPVCLVLFDDTEVRQRKITGKGAKAIPFLLEQGFMLEWVSGGQALLSRGAGKAEEERGRKGEGEQRHDGAARWEGRTPLVAVPGEFAQATHSPALMEYLTTVRRLCPPGSRTCEIGTTDGYAPIWLSHQGIEAAGLVTVPELAERSRQINNVLGGRASFSPGDPFTLCDPSVSLCVLCGELFFSPYLPVHDRQKRGARAGSLPDECKALDGRDPRRGHRLDRPQSARSGL